MNEPRRLSEGEGSEAARRLLRGASPSRPLRDDERRRALARLPVAGAVVGAGLFASTRGLALTALAGASVGVAIVVGGPVLSAWYEQAATRSATRPSLSTPARPGSPPALTPSALTPSALTPPTSPPLAPGSTDDPAVVPAPTASGSPASSSLAPGQKTSALPAPTAPAPGAPDDAFAREVTRLGQARARLASSPTQALADLDALASEFPASRLGLERELLRVEALLAAGRAGEARTRALALEPRVAGTLYADRLERLLDRMP